MESILMVADLVVTRHQGLVDYLRGLGLPEDVPVVEHVSSPLQLEGKVVVGVLPLHLAAAADLVIEIPLALQPEDRGKDLPLERVREIAGQPRVYRVNAGPAGDIAAHLSRLRGRFAISDGEVFLIVGATVESERDAMGMGSDSPKLEAVEILHGWRPGHRAPDIRSAAHYLGGFQLLGVAGYDIVSDPAGWTFLRYYDQSRDTE